MGFSQAFLDEHISIALEFLPIRYFYRSSYVFISVQYLQYEFRL